MNRQGGTAGGGTRRCHPGEVPVRPAGTEQEFAGWLERVCATYQAVRYTVAHRLADPGLAEPVAVQVVAGLVARPAVFRHFGLPYSGRIASLAEARIAEADAGELAAVCRWTQLLAGLESIPAEHRVSLVVTCVQGAGVVGLAAELGCAQATAQARHEAMLTYLEELTRPGRAPRPAV